MLFSEFPGALRMESMRSVRRGGDVWKRLGRGPGVGVCQVGTGRGFVGGEIACINTWSPGSHTGCQYHKRKVLLALGTKCPFAAAEQWVSSVCHKPGQKLLSRCIAVSPNSCVCSRKESPGSELASAFHCGDDFTSWQLRAPFWASIFYNHQFLGKYIFCRINQRRKQSVQYETNLVVKWQNSYRSLPSVASK